MVTQISVSVSRIYLIVSFRSHRLSITITQTRVVLPMLASLIYTEDSDTLADACWAISYLSDGPNSRIQSVIEAGVSRRLVELLMHDKVNVVSAALRAVGNIVTGDDVQTQVCFENFTFTQAEYKLPNARHAFKFIIYHGTVHFVRVMLISLFALLSVSC